MTEQSDNPIDPNIRELAAKTAEARASATRYKNILAEIRETALKAIGKSLPAHIPDLTARDVVGLMASRIDGDSYTIKRIHDVTRDALGKIGENVPEEPLVPAVERLAGLAVSAEEQLAEARRKVEPLDLDARDLRGDLEQARDLDAIRDVIVEAFVEIGQDVPDDASVRDLVDQAVADLVSQHKDLATLRERDAIATNELAETRKVLAEILEDLGGNPTDLATARTPEVANTLGVKIAAIYESAVDERIQRTQDLDAARAELARVRADRELIRTRAYGNGRELDELKAAHRTLSDLYVRVRGDLAHAHEELARLHAQVAKHEDRGLVLVQETARQAQRDARVARAEATAAEAEARAIALRDEADGLRWMLTERTEELVKLRAEIDAKRVEVQAPGGAS